MAGSLSRSVPGISMLCLSVIVSLICNLSQCGSTSKQICTRYQYAVHECDSRFDLLSLSQCGSTCNCLSRKVHEIHSAWTSRNQEANLHYSFAFTSVRSDTPPPPTRCEPPPPPPPPFLSLSLSLSLSLLATITIRSKRDKEITDGVHIVNFESTWLFAHGPCRKFISTQLSLSHKGITAGRCIRVRSEEQRPCTFVVLGVSCCTPLLTRNIGISFLAIGWHYRISPGHVNSYRDKPWAIPT